MASLALVDPLNTSPSDEDLADFHVNVKALVTSLKDCDPDDPEVSKFTAFCASHSTIMEKVCNSVLRCDALCAF